MKQDKRQTREVSGMLRRGSEFSLVEITGKGEGLLLQQFGDLASFCHQLREFALLHDRTASIRGRLQHHHAVAAGVMWCCVAFGGVTWCYVVLCCVIWCYAVLYVVYCGVSECC